MSDIFSNIEITPLKSQMGKMLAHGKLLVSGVIEVKFTVIEGTKGVFANLPSKKGKKNDENGKAIWYSDVKFPNKDVYDEFQQLIKSEYGKTVGQSSAGEENQAKDDGCPF